MFVDWNGPYDDEPEPQFTMGAWVRERIEAGDCKPDSDGKFSFTASADWFQLERDIWGDPDEVD